MANVLARKTMTTELAVFVKMNILIILVVLIVIASQTTQMTVLMSVLRKVANVLVRKTMATELAMNAQMGTLVILIANLVTVNLVTQLELYVTKLMDLANVWKNSAEEHVIFVMKNSSIILIAIIVNVKKTAPKIAPTFVT